LKTVEKISKKFAGEIERLIDLQFHQEPFTEMKLSSVDVLRAKTCLAIYNLAYFIFWINPYIRIEPDRIKKIIDLTYSYFYKHFQQKYRRTDIIFSEIVVNPKEQTEIITISKEWFVNYGLYVRTFLHNLFPMLYKYRIPIYLDNIYQSMHYDEKGLMLPVSLEVHQFSDEFLKEPNSDFEVKFDFIINLETRTRIVKIINNNI